MPGRSFPGGKDSPVFLTRKGNQLRYFSFPSSAWERTAAKLRFAAPYPARKGKREAELRDLRSQAELGNEGLHTFLPSSLTPVPAVS
jgi:hypothetical protein